MYESSFPLVDDQERWHRWDRPCSWFLIAPYVGSWAMTAPYYAEAFAMLPAGCPHWRAGRPVHCPEPPVWRGTWRARNGRQYVVEACEGHRPAQGR